MGNLFQNYGELSTLEYWDGHFMKGTLRATGDILGGCFCYKAGEYLRRFTFTTLGKTLFTIIEWSCYLASIAYIYAHPSSKYDYFILLLFMIGVTITYADVSLDRSLFRHKIFPWLGNYSFSLYLGHSCWRKYTGNIFPKTWQFEQRLAAYIVISMLTGLFILYASLWLRQVWTCAKPGIQKMLIEEKKQL